MSDRERDMGRLAAREQDRPDDSDGESEQHDDAQESSQSAEGDGGATNPSVESDAAESASERPAVNVKDREATLFAYLPESLNNDVDLACQSVNLTYQRESGEKLGRNRYLYPIILMVGADDAVDLSYEEIQSLVERVDEVEDAV
jgi:hypothetical protein